MFCFKLGEDLVLGYLILSGSVLVGDLGCCRFTCYRIFKRSGFVKVGV